MEKYLSFLSFCTLIVFLVSSCDTVNFEDIGAEPTPPPPPEEIISYEEDIRPINESRCLECHSLGGGAAFYPLTNFTEVSEGIDNILDRIQRPNGDPLRMPLGGFLSPDQINLYIQWRDDGLPENEN